MAEEHLLRHLAGWPATAIERLEARWITSVEQLIAIAATPDGITSLADEAKVPTATMRQLVDRAAAVLPAGVRDALSEPVDISQFSLGALPPSQRRRSLSPRFDDPM